MTPDLSKLYQSKSDTYFLHNQAFVEGVIIGACACPEIPLPDVWLPWTIKQHNKVENNAQADRIFEQLFDYFRQVLASVKQQSVLLPVYVEEVTSDEDITNNTEREDFLSGVLLAHQASERTWQMAWDKMAKAEPENMQVQAKRLKHCLMMFSTFANVKQALAKAKKQNNADLVEKLPTIAKSLPDAFKTYLAISDSLVEFLPDQFETQ